MGLDIYLVESYLVQGASPEYHAHITHNLIPMWREAGVYEALYRSEGKTARDIVHVLRAGLVALQAYPARFQALDAPNGWGTYHDAVPWLQRLIEACEMSPDARVLVSG